ncbi:MAG: BolA/IbaG family iron-sulfur metabolism protein [Solirubrobacteraceae bacterium]|nr:BolA/IbaG family iron-sulfur metabolism protein [Solirubrobacteraceae bacterium]MBJ7342962.1 BolA/IbaG family iron-sulfur metabolism protein [Solirubrobacteraceae bacterium]
MPTADEVKARIESGIPGSEADVTSDDNVHFSARVCASDFSGLSLVEQHRLVYAIFGEGELGGSIHALALTTEPR